jgi:hypothetical protein
MWKNQILFDSRSFFDVVIYGDASTSSKKKQKNVKIEYDDNEVKESKEVSQMVDNLRAEVKDEDVLLLLRLLLNDTNAQPKSITILKGKLSNTRKIVEEFWICVVVSGVVSTTHQTLYISLSYNIYDWSFW